MPTSSTSKNTSAVSKAVTSYLDGVEKTVEQVGEFQVGLTERYLGKAAGSLAQSQLDATKQVTAALTRIPREVIGA